MNPRQQRILVASLFALASLITALALAGRLAVA